MMSSVWPASKNSSLENSLKPPVEGFTQIITLKDGSTLIGDIVKVGDSSITVLSSIGELEIQINRIDKVQEIPLSSMRDGKFWFPNPNRTRLYFAPTARMLKAGEGYFSDYYLFFPGVAIGLTDNITIGGGMSLFPGVDFSDQLFYLTPKVGIAADENLSFAVGALIVGVPDWDDDGNSPTIGILFGVATAGSDDHSFTAGLGYGFDDDDLADKPAVMLGAETRFSRRAAFVTENWIFPDVDDALVSYGVRFFGEGLAVDLALVNSFGDDAIFPGFPYLDFVWNF